MVDFSLFVRAATLANCWTLQRIFITNGLDFWGEINVIVLFSSKWPYKNFINMHVFISVFFKTEIADWKWKMSFYWNFCLTAIKKIWYAIMTFVRIVMDVTFCKIESTNIKVAFPFEFILSNDFCINEIWLILFTYFNRTIISY